MFYLQILMSVWKTDTTVLNLLTAETPLEDSSVYAMPVSTVMDGIVCVSSST